VKTHKSALVLIPPEELWGPIQEIRRRHDRQVRRWMPHITLVYPFRPRGEFDACEARLREACARVEPFKVALARFRWFDHGSGYTIWLDPEPRDGPVRLQGELVSAFPDCDDTSRFESGFTPHLSVGQARDRAELEAILGRLGPHWVPLEFTARELAMIWRGPATGEVFRVDRTVPLGGG